jgi:hypothetical protein
MRVIAIQGTSRFLVDVGKGDGVIVDWGLKKAYPPRKKLSIVARGYWEGYEGPEDIIDLFEDLLKSVK